MRARAEPVLSAAKECPRDSGRDARSTPLPEDSLLKADS